MKHKLYICPVAKLTQYFPSIFQYIHPCIRVKKALDDKNINYKIMWTSFFRKYRTTVQELSNQSTVPVWINDKNEVMTNSHKIKSHLK